MWILLFVWFVSFASGRQSSYGVDEDILDEVFDQLQYDDNYDYDVAVEDVNYDVIMRTKLPFQEKQAETIQFMLIFLGHLSIVKVIIIIKERILT